MACNADKDCDCSSRDQNNVFTCACVEGQCASVIQELLLGNPVIDTSSRMDLEYDGEECVKNNGTWLNQYAECENASKAWCESMDLGTFDECASACRHDPKATMCTMQCVPVCKFPGW
jgi:hypothetical protein